MLSEISSNLTLNFFQCDIGFLHLWYWISSNIKFDFFKCEVGFLQMWYWISSSKKIGLLFIWNQIFISVKLDFVLSLIVWYRLGFMVLTLTHGIDFDSFYELRLKKALTKGGSPLLELKVGLRSRRYLLVYKILKNFINNTIKTV